MKKIKKKFHLSKETITRLNAFQLNSFMGGIGDVKKSLGIGPNVPSCGSENTANGTCNSSCFGAC